MKNSSIKNAAKKLTKSHNRTTVIPPKANRQLPKRLSGPRLGRPAAVASATTRKQEYQDNTDRIEVERVFSLSKRCYGMGLIVTKLKETQLTTIALSVFVTNRFKDSDADTFCPLTDISFF